MLVYQRVYQTYPALLGWSVDPDDPSVSHLVPAQTVTTGITSHVLKQAYYTHLPDACVIELDDGKIWTGKPDQFDGKNPWVSG